MNLPYHLKSKPLACLKLYTATDLRLGGEPKEMTFWKKKVGAFSFDLFGMMKFQEPKLFLIDNPSFLNYLIVYNIKRDFILQTSNKKSIGIDTIYSIEFSNLIKIP